MTFTVDARSEAEPASGPGRERPPFARLPVLAIGGALAAILLVTSSLGGYEFQEMYFIAAGQHPAWGYADQPWLVPVLASALDSWFGGSLVALRLPSTVVASLGVVVTALIAREVGGERGAQTLAAVAYASAWGLLGLTHILATTALDPFWWLLVTWLVTRWVSQRSRGQYDDRLLLWAGLVTAVALQTKFLVPVLWVGLALSVASVGPRDLLTRGRLWIAGAIATAVTVPTLVWQATHGWPNLVFTRTVAHESARPGLVLAWPMFAGPVGAVLCVYAVWRFFRSEALRPYRFLPVTIAVVIGLLMILDARAYYDIGLFPALAAVGAVEFERRGLLRRMRWIVWPVGAAACGATALILAYASFHTAGPYQYENAQPTARAYHQLQPAKRSHTAVIAEQYQTAAMLDHYAPALDLPTIFSPNRGWYYFATPPEQADSMLYVGSDISRFRPYFQHLQPVGEPGSGMWLLEGRDRPWQVIWPRVQSGLTE